MMGSAKKVSEAIAVDMSKTKWPSGKPMFNVTMLTEANNPKMAKKASATFHPYNLDYNVSSYFSSEGLDFGGFGAHENRWVEELIERDDSAILKDLRSRNYDIAWSFFLPFETVIMKRSGAPIVKWGTFLVDLPLLVSLKIPLDLAANLPLFHPFPKMLHTSGERAYFSRLLAQVSMTMASTAFNSVFYPLDRFNNPDSRRLHKQSYTDILVGDGIYGISEVKQEP